MEIRLLRYFLMIANEGNMTKAAEKLHTSQSNLSKQLKELEERYNVELFNRENRKMILTEEGRFLKYRAQEIITLSDKLSYDLKVFDESLSGIIHLGTVETRKFKDIGKTIKKITHDYAKISFNIYSASIEDLLNKLDAGILDFALIIPPINLDRYNYLKLPIKENFSLLVSKDHKLAKQDRIESKDIIGEKIWLAHQQIDGNVLSGWLGENTTSIESYATFNLITNISFLIEENMGIAFTFKDLVRTYNTNLKFIDLNPSVETDFYLIWNKNLVQSKVESLFVNQIKQDFL